MKVKTSIKAVNVKMIDLNNDFFIKACLNVSKIYYCNCKNCAIDQNSLSILEK